MKKFLSLALTLAMMAGVFAGCGKTGGDTAQDPAKSDPTAVSYQKDVVFGMTDKQVSIDPHANSNTQHNYLFRMVFDTLVGFDNKTLELLPKLATKWENVEGKTWTFHLREDAKFHNGEPVHASDVVYTFKRAVGTTASNSMAVKIADIRADGDFTVIMDLVDANVDWAYLMTLPTAVVMSEKAITEDATKGFEIGSGPWKVDSYEFGDFTKLVANTDYWGEKPKAETFTFKIIPEASARLIALQTGEIDICQDPSNMELDFIRDDEKLELQEYKGGSCTYLAFNTQKAPMNNVDFRKAVGYAIDIPALIEVATNGTAEKAESFWGWNEFGYDGGKTGYTQDLDKAKEYLAKAYPNGGAKMSISISAGVRKTCAELMQEQLKKVGIELTINELDGAGLSKHTTNGEHESCIYGCGFNVFGDDMRRILTPGTAVNKSHYDSKEVMALLDSAVGEADEAKRKEQYAEVQQIIFNDAAYIPLFFEQGFFGVKKGVTGIDYYPTSHHDFSNVAVEISK